MAAASSLEPLLECAVCLEDYKDPRILPRCGHHFCLTCIQGIADMHPQGDVSCPTCRNRTTYIDTSIQQLPKALLVNELMSKRDTRGSKKSEDPKQSRECDICRKEDAKYYCYNCKDVLCVGCHSNHLQLFEGHEVQNAGAVSFCACAQGQVAAFFCHPCSVAMCQRCVQGSHRGHSAVTVSQYAGECRQRVAALLGADTGEEDARRYLDYITTRQGDAETSARGLLSVLEKQEKLVADYSKLLGEAKQRITGTAADNRRRCEEVKAEVTRAVTDHQAARKAALKLRGVSDTELVLSHNLIPPEPPSPLTARNWSLTLREHKLNELVEVIGTKVGELRNRPLLSDKMSTQDFGGELTGPTVVQGEMSAKTTYTRSAKGRVTISESASADGKFIALENTGRKEENLSGWRIKRVIDGVVNADHTLERNFTMRPGGKVKIFAAGWKPGNASPNDVECNLRSWGIGDIITTTLINPAGEDRATHVQKTIYTS